MTGGRKAPHPQPLFVAAARGATGAFVAPRYRLSYSGHDALNAAEPPFIVVANHVGFWDPFLINVPVRHVIQYVTSDNIYRTPLFGAIMRGVGSIPKTKFMPDPRAVATIVRVAAAGGVIGIFPEARRSWDGRTIEFSTDVARLIKRLGLPVFSAVVRGLYLSKPRWARTLRRGRVHIAYRRLFDGGDLAALSLEETHGRLRAEILSDEMEEQRHSPVSFHGRARAEYLERLLFLCSRCHGLGTIRSAGHRVTCTRCGDQQEYGVDGFLRGVGSTERFDTLFQWNDWQTGELPSLLSGWGTEAPLSEQDAKIYTGYRDRPLAAVGRGLVRLFPGHVELPDTAGTLPRSVAVSDCLGVNVQNKEKLEFYVGKALARIDFLDRRAPTYLWFRSIDRQSPHPTRLPASAS